MIRVAILSSHNGSGFETLYKATQDKSLELEIPLVISNNTNAVVLDKANKYNIKNYVINTKNSLNVDEDIYKLLKQSKCDYVFLSGYMKKISPKLTNNFTIINSHPSLLPNYGGTGMYGKFVHEAVIKDKASISGVTIHEVNENYDEGKILLQKQLYLAVDETAESLETKVKALEKIAIVETFEKLCLK